MGFVSTSEASQRQPLADELMHMMECDRPVWQEHAQSMACRRQELLSIDPSNGPLLLLSACCVSHDYDVEP